MVKFKRIRLKNFLSFKDQEESLDNRGIVLVLGQNNDTIHGGSNGSGKSALYADAIYYSLFGKSLRDMSPLEIVSRGEKESVVELEFSVNGSDYIVTRTRKGKVGDLKVVQDNKDISLKDSRETQKQIINKLLDPQITKSAIIFSGTVFESFVLLGDAEKKRIITSILGFDKIEKAKEITKQKANEINQNIITIDTKKTSAINYLDNFKKELEELKKKDIEELKKKIKEEENAIKELTIIEQEADKKVKNCYEKNLEIQSNLSDLKDKLNKTRNEQIKIELSQSSLEKEIDKKKKLLVKGICPECGQDVKEDSIVGKSIDKLAQDIVETMKQSKEFEPQLKEMNEEIKKQENKLRSDNVIQALKDRYNKYYLDLELVKGDYNKLVQEKKVYESKLEDLLKRINDCEIEIKNLEQELKGLEKTKEVYDFWVEGFGAQGIISYILDAYFPRFNKVLNEYLQILFGTGILARFVPFTTLRSGVVREKWDFDVQGLGSYKSCSSGEKRRLDLAILFSLWTLVSDMLGGTNILIVDEVFDPLDDIGVERTVELLNQLSISSIFVITHDQYLQEKFENVVYIEKRNGVSKIK
jgi:DNA repair exonuclease SbcCD ATPase subunit